MNYVKIWTVVENVAQVDLKKQLLAIVSNFLLMFPSWFLCPGMVTGYGEDANKKIWRVWFQANGENRVQNFSSIKTRQFYVEKKQNIRLLYINNKIRLLVVSSLGSSFMRELTHQVWHRLSNSFNRLKTETFEKFLGSLQQKTDKTALMRLNQKNLVVWDLNFFTWVVLHTKFRFNWTTPLAN